MNKKAKLALTLFYLITLTLSVSAQEKEPAKTDSTLSLKWLTKNFLLKSPDTGFVPLVDGSGYEKKEINATLKIVTLPGNYISAKKELLNLKISENSLRIDVVYNTINNKETVSIISEEISPDKAKYENFILIMTILEVDDVTVVVTGSYPKSHDKSLRQKFIQTSINIEGT